MRRVSVGEIETWKRRERESAPARSPQIKPGARRPGVRGVQPREQRWSRVFEPAQGSQRKQVYYTDFVGYKTIRAKLSKKDTLTFSRYRPT